LYILGTGTLVKVRGAGKPYASELAEIRLKGKFIEQYAGSS